MAEMAQALDSRPPTAAWRERLNGRQIYSLLGPCQQLRLKGRLRVPAAPRRLLAGGPAASLPARRCVLHQRWFGQCLVSGIDISDWARCRG